MHGRRGERRRDFDSRVLPAGGGAANEERQAHVTAFHLLGDEHHLVE